jgi:hypothetical protein
LTAAPTAEFSRTFGGNSNFNGRLKIGAIFQSVCLSISRTDSGTHNYIWLLGIVLFHLPHMEYEGSIGFVMRKNEKKIIANFHVLGLFLAKKHDLSDDFPSYTRRCRT